MVLQIIFGMTATPVSIYFILKVWTKDPDKSPTKWARLWDSSSGGLRSLSKSDIRPFKMSGVLWLDLSIIFSHHLIVPATQNNFYNGWTHDHYVRAVIVVCPDGTIPICCYNCVPGSVHDSMIAEMGKGLSKNRGKCTVDSAFWKQNYLFLIKSGPSNEGLGETWQEFRENARLQADATSMWYSAEWGMRSLQASFPRLKECFIYEEHGESKVIMKSMLLLYNLRARKVGINQLQNTYLPALDVNVDNIFRCQLN